MTTAELDLLRFPIGNFIRPESITAQQISAWIQQISNFPNLLENEVSHLSNEQLNTEYRPGGWKIHQVIHHCADSHMNSLIRFKLALTEENPTIKPYREDLWAKLSDSKNYPIQDSLIILQGVHARWTSLLSNLSPEDLKRTFVHPESGNTFSNEETIGLYAWHCAHHLAHITHLKKRKAW